MTHYHFHLRTAAGVERDEIGLTCVNLEAAYLDACRAIPGLMTELMRKGHDPGCCAFEIHDRADQLLMEVPFLERVRRSPRPQLPDALSLSPETQALFNQLDLITLAIGSETTRLRANMEVASKQLAIMRVTQANLLWSFQTWSECKDAP
jgi:hypothetical protein